ncbi:MAG: MBL fold metallo-hydrolase, partial [Dongiaceae bacterium]
MKIEFITNASFLINFDNGRKLLTDPWYTDGIYLGTLFNFPPLSDEQRQRYLGSRPDFIYISHFHGDHLDPDSLRRFAKSTPILIGAFPTPTLRNAIRSCGFTDVRELPFGDIVPIDGFEVTIYPQFSASTDDSGSEDSFPIDSSILVRESNGPSLFFCVDNPMQVSDASYIRDRFGPPDVALLPYSGASIYPWVFKNYSHEDKLKRATTTRLDRLEKFCRLADEIAARYVVPAAGSFVYGGRIAAQSQYQLQATPVEILKYLETRPLHGSLHLMATGDVLDCRTGSQEMNHGALFRNFSEAERISYAATLSDFRCPVDDISWPVALRIPWRSLVRRARGNMWQRQQEIGVFPARNIELLIGTRHASGLTGDNVCIRFLLDQPGIADATAASD